MAESEILQKWLISLNPEPLSDEESQKLTKPLDALGFAAGFLIGKFTNLADTASEILPHMARSLASIYFESQRLNVPAKQIESLGYAAEQFGSSVGEAKGYVEHLFNQFQKFGPNFGKSLEIQLGNFGYKDVGNIIDKAISAAKAEEEMRKVNPSAALGIREELGLSLQTAIAMNKPEFALGMKEAEERRGKDFDLITKQAVEFFNAANRLDDALKILGERIAAKIFEDYGNILNTMSKWIDENGPKIADISKETFDEVNKAFKDLSIVWGPVFSTMKTGLLYIGDVINKILGGNDQSGLRAIRFLLDGLGSIIIGSLLWKVITTIAGLTGLSQILRFIRLIITMGWDAAVSFAGGLAEGLGPEGLAAVGGLAAGAAGAYFMGTQPLNEGEDERYRQTHPGWVPGQPKDPNWNPSRSDKEGLALGFEKQSRGPEPPPGSGDPVAFAESINSLRDHDPEGHAAIKEFLRTGGHGMDPATVSWCAAFVGSALHKAGYKDIPQVQGGDVANAYQRWGKPVNPKDVQRGDVVITTRGLGPGAIGGHVSLATGPIVNGKIPVIEGDVRDNPSHGGMHHVQKDFETIRPDIMIRRGERSKLITNPLKDFKPLPENHKYPWEESRLPGPRENLAALKSITKDIGSRNTNNQIVINTTDPMTAARLTAQHFERIHKDAVNAIG